MFHSHAHRRDFLKRVAGGSVCGFTMPPLLAGLRPVSASEARLAAPSAGDWEGDVADLAKLLETLPRDRVIEEMAWRVSAGRVTYRELLAALLLAGVQNIEPRPAVGFKFHAVLVVNSAHLASLASPDADRWLPLFWALDFFKSSQARAIQEGGWTQSAVNEAGVPTADVAIERFRQAMDRWDVEQADVATAAMARGPAAHAVFDAYAAYAARDFRSIGHKVIYLANAYRTLQTIGWQFAEPVLRSLSYAMLNHVGDPDPVNSDLVADRDGRLNEQRLKSIRGDWLQGRVDSAATEQLLTSLRQADSDDACQLVIEQINAGVNWRSVFDALFAFAAELTMRQPAIVPLHAMTTTNAIHYVFQTCSDDATRRYLLLQNTAFLPRFRDAAAQRGDLPTMQLDQLQPAEGDSAAVTAESIFETLGSNPAAATSATLSYLQSGQSVSQLVHHARRLIFLKGTDSHDYKYSSAVLEDFYQISPAWRDRYLAAALYKMRDADQPTTSLVGRIQAALTG